MNPALNSLRRPSTLQIALGISVLVHALVLTVRLVDPEGFNRVFHDTPLEVVLVNAKGDKRPEKAHAIAQASLAGGGDAQKGRATSPLPSMREVRLGDTPEENERLVEALRLKQSQILTQIKQQLASQSPPDLQAVNPNAESATRERQSQLLTKLLAEIEKRINEENARPRKRYISPATREEVYAVYYDELRRRIEDRGTANFPESDGHKLYGELIMVITINHKGTVLGTEVVQTSRNTTLDRRAESIVRSLSFGKFTEAMRRRADQIVVVSRFRFTRDAGLQTQLGGQ